MFAPGAQPEILVLSQGSSSFLSHAIGEMTLQLTSLVWFFFFFFFFFWEEQHTANKGCVGLTAEGREKPREWWVVVHDLDREIADK
jgi:hypothetical protein